MNKATMYPTVILQTLLATKKKKRKKLNINYFYRGMSAYVSIQNRTHLDHNCIISTM